VLLLKRGLALCLCLLLCLCVTGCRKKQTEEPLQPAATPVQSQSNAAESEEPAEEEPAEAEPEIDYGELIEYNDVTYKRKEMVKTYLVMGIDDAEYEGDQGNLNGGQADAIGLLVVDEQAECYTVLQLDRDTICEVQVLNAKGKVVGTQEMQLCLAHAFGTGGKDSCENTKQAVETLLMGKTIDRYAALYMNAIPLLNDAVGGVTVTIEDDFSQSDKSLVQGETITLNGEQVNTFVQARMSVGEGDNTSRMRRQRTYLSAYLKSAKAKLKEQPSLVFTLYNTIHKYLISDVKASDLITFAKCLSGYTNNGFMTIEGTHQVVNDHMTFQMDEEDIMGAVVQLLYEEYTEE